MTVETSKLHPTLHRLRAAFQGLLPLCPDIAAFCDGALGEGHSEMPLEARGLPVLDDLPGIAGMGCAMTQGVVDAVLVAAPHLAWRQSYTVDDPGFDADYLSHYGWFNLIAPSGPFVSERLRLSVGYWGKVLHYPRHWHKPEEIYLTLAGEARYISEGRADIMGGPGATVAHHSGQPHAAAMETAPLLAAAFWRGAELEAKPGLG